MALTLSRRRLFRGAAVTIALPFLPSLARRRASAATCPATPRRFVAWYTPNGFHMPDFTPMTTGKGWTAPLILEPLTPVRNKLQVITGLENQSTARPALPPGNHGGGTGCFLTQIHVNNNYDDPNRVSLDQVIAASLEGCTPLPSLQLGIESSSSTGTCDGAPCVFSRSISWSKGSALANVVNPQVAFDRLFAGRDRPLSDADAQRRRALRTSVLDHVLEESKALGGELGATDRRKLDQFATGLRELEARIQRLGASGGASACVTPARPPQQLPVPEHVQTMTDLMALALQCDLTRVITFMIANSGTGRDHGFIGAPGGFHGLSHHQGDVTKWEKLKKIGRWEVEQLAAFLKKLDAAKDPDGRTVLDNTCVFFSSEIADGDRHNHWDKPTILAGGLGGMLAANGQHVSYTRMTFPRPPIGPQGGAKVGDLFMSILRGFGISVSRFGENGTKPLPEVMA